MRRRAIIAVVGGGQNHVPPLSSTYSLAESVGHLIAARGGILLCGGGSGVMEAAAKGAFPVRGQTIGIMKEQAGRQKSHLGLMVWTGLEDGRNFVNAAAADAMIALEGESGTLSEIALALKLRRPVICLKSWEFLAQAGFPIRCCTQPDEAVAAAFQAIGAFASGFVETAIAYPCLPDQTVQHQTFEAAVNGWSGA